MVMKEAFVILWACIAIAFIMQILGMTNNTTYILRSAFTGIGFTMFCLRILISRCYRHWVPKAVERAVDSVLDAIQNLFPKPDERRKSSVSVVDLADLDGPAFAEEIPQDESLEEMQMCLADPPRAESFRKFADKALVVENVDFLLSVLKYKQVSFSLAGCLHIIRFVYSSTLKLKIPVAHTITIYNQPTNA
jgi:hypothetical protein